MAFEKDLKLNPLTADSLVTTGEVPLLMKDTVWDDLRFPVVGQRLDSASGRIGYNYDELTIEFQNNARYPEEFVGFIVQLPHAIKLTSMLGPHIHWIQNQDKIPNWLISWRVMDTGDTVPAFGNLAIYSDIKIVYAAGAISQLSDFPDINMIDSGLSRIYDVKIYRDTANASGLFAGADSYTGDASLKEFDIHVQYDTLGSKEEYIK